MSLEATTCIKLVPVLVDAGLRSSLQEAKQQLSSGELELRQVKEELSCLSQLRDDLQHQVQEQQKELQQSQLQAQQSSSQIQQLEEKVAECTEALQAVQLELQGMGCSRQQVLHSALQVTPVY